MSTHPNNNKFVALFVVIVGVILVSKFVSTTTRPGARYRSGPVRQTARTNVPQPERNPIIRMIEDRSGIVRRPGTAVAVLVDVSGSMSEPVSGAYGNGRPKIEIARESVLRLIKQVDRFAHDHPDRLIRLGIYEFSARGGQRLCRRVAPMGPPDLARMEAGVGRMVAGGDTPIGDALIYAKQELNATGMAGQHILVVTDGENNRGYAPADVVDVISRLPEEDRAGVYCIAFDIAADRFRALRDAGGLVLGAMNEGELQQTMDYVLTGKILAEQPEVPKGQ